MISKELLLSGCAEMGVTISEEAADRLDLYARRLVEYNEKVNLTAITAPDEIVNKHFVDSLTLLKYAPLSAGASLCDVGTGAGFPGLVLLAAVPELKVTLMDSVNKKLDFSRALVSELGLSADIVTIRAEDAGKRPEYRETFDVVTARAVAQLNLLAEYCVPLVKVGGVFAPLKAVLSDEERQRGCGAAANLGAAVDEKHRYTLPDGSEREIVIFKKNAPTPGRYPRNAAQIAKKPL